MKNTGLILQVLRGALRGGVIALVGSAIILAVVGTIFGYGPQLPLYYGAGLLLYVLPAGLLIGAGVIAFRQLRRSSRSTRLAYSLVLGVPLLLLVGLALLPYRLTNVEKIITHGARWTIATDQPECPNAVILMLVQFADYEVVCSPVLLDYLLSQNTEVIPLQYRVTSDFGSPRSYQLIKVGSVDVTWEQWRGGPSGCGSKYLPPCNSPQAQNSLSLVESSWTDE